MSNSLFILKDEVYKNGLFPQIPEYNKKGSWILLTEGVADDIIVDSRTTVKQIRQGQYKRLVEISKSPLSYEHEFNSSCKETSYTFTVKVKARVFVNDPIDFYSNVRNVDIKAFFNNQFSLDVNKITRMYSILDYNGIDDDLTRALTSTKVVDDTTGLSYQISAVMTQPNEQAMKILKQKDDMEIRQNLKHQAGAIAQTTKGKSFEDAVWEEVAQGSITDSEAIKRIEDYNRQGFQEKIAALLKLRDEGFITDTDLTLQTQHLLPTLQQANANTKALPAKETSGVDEFFDE